MPLPAPPVAFGNSYTNVTNTGTLTWSEEGNGTPYNGGINFEPSGVAFKIVFGAASPFADIEELFSGRTGVPWSANQGRSYIRKFRVRTKTTTDFNNAVLLGPVFIATCPGLPRPYSPYIPYRKEEWDLKALAVNIQCDQELGDDSQSWIVTISYSTDMPAGGPRFGQTYLGWITYGDQNNPWMIPPVLEYDGEVYTDYPATDILGKAYQDTVGRPFNPPRGVMRGDRVLTITRNEQFFEDRAEDYVFKVNSVPFKGYQIGYCLSFPPRASEQWLGPTKFWRVTYKVLMRKRIKLLDGTYNSPFSPAKVLNAGMYQKRTLFVPGVGVLPITGIAPIIRFGMQVSAPVLLNSSGQEETQIDPITGQLKQTYLSFDDYESADLNQLLISGV